MPCALAIAAHPDDIEFVMAGTLLLLGSAGWDVHCLNLSAGNLGSLTTTIGKQGGNISNLKITNRSTDFFEIMVDIQVADVKHLSTIIAALRATPVINSVERARG